jgi:hypothetical protein
MCCDVPYVKAHALQACIRTEHGVPLGRAWPSGTSLVVWLGHGHKLELELKPGGLQPGFFFLPLWSTCRCWFILQTDDACGGEGEAMEHCTPHDSGPRSRRRRVDREGGPTEAIPR